MAFTKVATAGINTTENFVIDSINSIGVVTASSFSGPISGTASLASGLTGTPDISIRNITGVAATFTGVVTYEDVTNIDSVGIITARKLIDANNRLDVVGGANVDQVNVTGVSTFTGTIDANGLIDADGGANIVGGSTIDQVNVTGVSTFAGDVTINTTKKILTNSSQGQLTIQPGPTYPGGSIKFAGGQSGTTDIGSLIFYAGETTSLQERVRLKSDGKVGIGTNNPNNPLTIHASGNHIFLKDTATNNILQIRHASGVAEFNSYDLDGNARRDYVFNQYSSEALRIDSNGDILINSPPGGATGKLVIRGAGAYAVTNSGKALEGIDINVPTVGDGNFGGAISFTTGGVGRSAIAAVQEGSDDDKNGLAFFTHASATGGDNTTEALRITAVRNILAGTTSSRAVAGGYAKLQIEATSSEGLSLIRTSADNGSVYLSLGKTRNGSVCQAGDKLGTISWNADDGTDLNHASAEILTEVASGIGGNDVPGDLVFKTNGGTTTTTERLRIDSSGDISIGNGAGYAVWNNTGNDQRPRFQLKQTAGDDRGVVFLEERGDANGMDVFISKSRGGNGAGAITSGDTLGILKWSGGDGTRQHNAAGIQVWNNGTIATGRVAGNMSFYTAPDSASSMQERLRITSAGLVQVGKDNQSSTTFTQNLDIRGRYVNAVGDFARLMFRNSTDSGNSSASIRAERFGDNYGTNITFWTQAHGGGSGGDGAERLRINSSGIEVHNDLELDGSINCGNYIRTNYDGGAHVYIKNNSQGANYSTHFQTYLSSNEGGTTQTHMHYYHGGYAELLHQGTSSVRTLSNGTQFRNGGSVNGQITPDGICFGSETAANHALDDYEEGTWTPANQYLTVTNNNTAVYTKVGRLVTVQFDITYASSPADTAQVGGRIEGLPFQPQGNGFHFSPTWQDSASGNVDDNENLNFLSYVEGSSNNMIKHYSIGNNCEAIRAQTAGKRCRGTVTYMST